MRLHIQTGRETPSGFVYIWWEVRYNINKEGSP